MSVASRIYTYFLHIKNHLMKSNLIRLETQEKTMFVYSKTKTVLKKVNSPG